MSLFLCVCVGCVGVLCACVFSLFFLLRKRSLVALWSCAFVVGDLLLLLLASFFFTFFIKATTTSNTKAHTSFF